MKYLPYILTGIVIILVIYMVSKKEKDKNPKREINFQPDRVKMY